MNIELIKKYKTEFDHFLNEGKLLTRTKSNFIWNDKINEDLMWDFEIQDIDIIIDDEYSELRKALCDGKTIQAYYKFNDTWNDIIKPEFKDNVSNYRIKPEEPKFKIGNFVRYINSNNNKALRINNINCGFYYFDDTGMSLRIDEMIKWNPNPKELCWFTNDTTELRAVLGQFDCMTHDNFYKATNGSSYSNCEPFINSKPSWFE